MNQTVLPDIKRVHVYGLYVLQVPSPLQCCASSATDVKVQALRQHR